MIKRPLALRIMPIWIVLTWLLAGCATQTLEEVATGSAPDNWNDTRDQLIALDNWHFTGKLGVRFAGESESAVINRWRQQGESFKVDISSAVLGLGAVTLEGSPDGMLFQRSGERPIYSDDPVWLLQQETGWTIPLSQLFYWLRGIPSPEPREALVFTDTGRLASFQQAGWQIEYRRHQQVASLPLPGKIRLSRDDVRIILVITEWNLQPASDE